MKILRDCAKVFRNMLPKPKILLGNYVPSKYNYIQKLEETVVVNTFSRAIAVPDKQEEALLRQEVVFVDPDTCSDAVKQMITLRMLVPEGTDELKLYLEVYELLYTIQGNRKKSFYKIFTTMACNARCFYCFEQGTEIKTMTDETVDALFDYIMATRHNKTIVLYWFGGEPLCNVRAITRLCQKLQAAEVPYVSRMVTNGLLLDEKMAEEAETLWKLNWCQITLDGMHEEYKKRKNYKGNIDDPFTIVVDNIERLAKKGVKMIIRMNVDNENIDDILKLKAYLTDRFGQYQNVSVYPAAIFDEWFGYSNPIPEEKKKKLFEKCAQISDAVEQENMQVSNALSADIPTTYCMANDTVSAIISPDGKLYTCQSHSDAMCYGDIRSGITKPELYEKWTHNREPVEKCRTCPLLPQCTAFQLCPTGSKDCKSKRFASFDRKLQRTYLALKK